MVDAAGGPARSRADDDEPRSEGFRWGAQLNMLHNLAATLNTFDDVGKIGESITAELRTIIDYHNCRVYLLRAQRTHPDADRVPG